MPFNFDATPDRRTTNSIKWTLYEPDVLPFWTADMDFPAPEPIRSAIQRTLEHGVLGYEFASKALKKTVAERMARVHGWQVEPDWVVATPGVISGFTAAAQTVCQPGQGMLFQPPSYPPFYEVHTRTGLVEQLAPLAPRVDGQRLRYEIDWDVFRSAIHSRDARTGMFLLCNPHNPTGQVHSRADLERMAAICLENDIVICSDEIHNEHLLPGGARHTVLASLSPEIAARTITLVAPSKTFNVPGLFCAFAIIPNDELRQAYRKTTERLTFHISSLSLVAAEAAFGGECDDWLSSLRGYILQSREIITETLTRDFPEIRFTMPEATYMAWLDCSALVESGRIEGAPQEFFLNKARVGLSNGADFGEAYKNFVRLVFGCSHDTLREGLARMKKALDEKQ